MHFIGMNILHIVMNWYLQKQYINDGTSLKSARQIRWSDYPEYNLGNTRTAKINILNYVKYQARINKFKG